MTIIKAYSLDQIVNELKEGMDKIDPRRGFWNHTSKVYYWHAAQIYNQGTFDRDIVKENTKFFSYLEEFKRKNKIKELLDFSEPIVATINLETSYRYDYDVYCRVRVYDTSTLSEILANGNVLSHLKNMPQIIQELYKNTGQLPQPNQFKRDFETFEDWSYGGYCGDCSEINEWYKHTSNSIKDILSTISKI